MHGEFLIPIFLGLGFFAMIFGIVYMNKRENLAMVEKGMNPKQYRPVPYKNLKWGLLLIGAGIGLFLAYILSEHILVTVDKYGRYNDENPAIYFSLIAIGGGLGLISSYRIEKRELLDKKNAE